jgi:outer membrane protein OmpU
MKKQLLTSTALVAAGVLALAPAAFSKPSLTVNGYHEQVLGMVINQDEDVSGDKSTLDVHHETEIHFNGNVKLDNGITMRAHTELETNGDQGYGGNSTGGPDYIDEIYLTISGSFGKIEIGSLDNVGARMVTGFIGNWPTGVGQNLTFDSAEWITSKAPDFDTVRDSRLIGYDSDSEKINYFTPRMNGFQVGVSYIPGDKTTEDQNGAMQGANATYHDGFAVATNYVNKVGAVSIGMGVGYLHMQAPETVTNTVNDDMKAAVAGIRVISGPLRIAVGGKRTASNEGADGTDRRGRVFDVGARYTMGANMYSLTYTDGERQSQDINYQAAMLSYAKILGPGVKWHANLIWADSNSGATKNSGMAVSTGVRLSF